MSLELDKRIKDITDIKSVTDGCHDWEFMTKKGYFANSIFDFKDLKRLCVYGEYAGWREHNQCFLCKQAGDETYYSYFLPEDRLLPEEPEKKYRPFTLDEFVNKYSLGDEIILKIKANNKIEHKLFIEYIEDEKNINARMNICLGGFYYSLKDLFDKSELYIDGGWKPFGVEE